MSPFWMFIYTIGSLYPSNTEFISSCMYKPILTWLHMFILKWYMNSEDDDQKVRFAINGLLGYKAFYIFFLMSETSVWSKTSKRA